MYTENTCLYLDGHSFEVVFKGRFHVYVCVLFYCFSWLYQTGHTLDMTWLIYWYVSTLIYCFLKCMRKNLLYVR